MKIGIIAPAPVPAVVGGAERLWRGLRQGLIERGHDVELVTVDFPERSLLEVLDGYERFAKLDVERFDVVITGKYPAWMINHPRHLVYMLHPLRGLYDTYPAHLGELVASEEGQRIADSLRTAEPADSAPLALIAAVRSCLADLGSQHPLAAYPGPLARHVIHRLDQLAFAPGRVQHFAAISHEVAGRSQYFPADAPVLVAHPESDLPLLGYGDEAGPSEDAANHETVFFTASRLDAPKRIDLIIDAFRTIRDRPATLRIAGDGPERERLVRFAGTDHRIEFLGRISEDELARNYANATAVVFTPDREDFGYISLEALRSGTPVITTTDSGGANELLDTGVGGLVVEPNPKALAEAMIHLADHPLERWLLGLNGQRRSRTADWSELWRLIEDLDPGKASDRPTILMLSTFGVAPTIGGGQRRVRHLARQLALDTNVTILALSGAGETTRRRTLELGLEEIVVPRSPQQRLAEAEITRVAELPVDDITCSKLWAASPEFVRELDRLLEAADLVVVSHPFLSPALKGRIGTRPLVYDCHNAETQFKSSVLKDNAAGRWLVESVREAETYAVAESVAITTCTDTDEASLRGLAPQASGTFGVIANGVDAQAMPRRSTDQARHAKAELLALVNAGEPESGAAQSGAEPKIATFLGSWHPPNLDAARLILEAARSCPEWLFVLAGSHTISLDASEHPNVRLLPTFAEETLFPLLAGADVALNPMVSGGGSNLKLYDYLAVGVPVLTTEVGARGLQNAREIVTICQPTAQGIREGLASIMTNTEAQQLRTQAGRELVENSVNWATLGNSWAALVLEALPEKIRERVATYEQRPARTEPPAPLLATAPPPHHDPTLELMTRMTAAAMQNEPPKDLETMDPTLRESLNRMVANKMAGQEIPAGARLRPVKQAIARAGKLVTNEQVVFNHAAVEAMTALTAQVQTLSTRVSELEADQRSHDNDSQ